MINIPQLNDEASRYLSLAALRVEHVKLLQQYRSRSESTELAPQIVSYIARGKATGALLFDEGERAVAQSLLDYWSTILYRTEEQIPDALLDEYDSRLAPELPDELSPYVGLDPFREENSDVFFGRQRLVGELVNRLREGRLLAVVGSSGSGKSSLVLSGLIPALKRGAVPGSDTWHYMPRMVPGSTPLANLARLLRASIDDGEQSDGKDAWLEQHIDLLRQDPSNVVRLVTMISDRPVALVVDQFEEVFTLCSDEAERTAFAANLLALTQVSDLRHSVILTMRTDFEPYVARLSEFQPSFEQAVMRVTPLNAAELREAIEEPAAMIGLRFEAGVVEALLHEILGEPAALPLLQFTLLKLWENRERNLISWNVYKRLGGGRLALARSADELYDSLIPEDQEAARRILLRLVRPGEGSEVTSGRVQLSTLYPLGEAHDRIDHVLQRLIDARLLRLSQGDRSSDTQIEVAHEALVRNWPRLVRWIDDERESIRRRVRVTEAAERWAALGKNPDALLRGVLLQEALDYGDLNALEREFVEASQAVLIAEEQAREEARRRELQQAQQRLRLIVFASVLVGLFGIASLFFGMWAHRNSQRAEEYAGLVFQALATVEVQATESAILLATVEVQATESAILLATLREERAAKGLVGISTATPTPVAEEEVELEEPDEEPGEEPPVGPVATPTPSPTLLPGAGLTDKLWPTGSTLRIKFLDDDPDVQEKVKQAALQWTEYANLEFDFGDHWEADIRISFEQPGAWSFLGADARTVPQSQPTMNLGVVRFVSDDEVNRAVLHEFGHALGLINEHQQPNATIPWDIEATYDFYTDSQYFWTRQQVDINLLSRYDPSLFSVPKPFDPESIMMHPIPNELTLNDFEVGWNDTLSELDKWAIAQLYPEDREPQNGERSPESNDSPMVGP